MTEDKIEKGRARAGGRVGFAGWVLLAVGLSMLGLHLCKNQGKLPRLAEWDFFLDGKGKVAVLSGDASLRATAAAGVELVGWDALPRVRETALSRDAEQLADALAAAGARLFIVGADAARIPVPGGDSVLTRLARFEPVEGFHALMIRPSGALYEARRFPDVSLRKMASLVRLVRGELSSKEVAAPGEEEAAGGGGGLDEVEVAVQLQGLAPEDVNKKKVARIRKELWATGRGATLEEAARAAARKAKRLFGDKHAASEGELGKAVARYTIELHVLYDFTLVDHLAGGMSDADYSRYLDAAFVPGVHGVYVNRPGLSERRYLHAPQARLRLPSDAIYWMRASGERIVERIARDTGAGSLEELGADAKLTVDRFRSVHAAEETPGGAVRLLVMGVPPVAAQEVTAGNVEAWGKGAAEWLGKALREDGTFIAQYYPDRDTEKTERPDELTFDASRAIAASAALGDAAALTGEERYRRLFESSLRMIAPLVVVCPGAGEAAAWRASGAAPRTVDACGPMQSTGVPLPAESWGQGGEGEKAIPEGMVFVFATTRAGIEESARFGLLVAAELDRLAGAGAAKGKGKKDARLRALRALLEGVVEFVLFMQRGDGSFQGYFVDGKNAYYRSQNPGGGLVALELLARAGAILADPRIDGAVRAASGYHVELLRGKMAAVRGGAAAGGVKEEKEVVEMAGWGIGGLARGAELLGDKTLAAEVAGLALDFVRVAQLSHATNRLVDAVYDGGFSFSPASVPDFRSIIASSGLAVAAGALGRMGLEKEAQDLGNAALAGVRFSAQLQMRHPGSAQLAVDKERASGGIMQSLAVPVMKVDICAGWLELLFIVENGSFVGK